MQIAECLQCHGNHDIVSPSDQMIGVGDGSVCTTCHSQGDNGYTAAEKMRTKLEELLAGLGRAEEILDRAERAGMEVSRPKFELSEAKDSLTHARVLIHSFSPAEVEKIATPGIEKAHQGYQAGEAAMAELSFRRKGLGISLFFILFLAGVVYLKLREIERKQPPMKIKHRLTD
jgi:predicted CXXCH cytochrome family protein